MTGLLLVLAVAFPLLLVLGIASQRLRGTLIRMLPAAALPGLALALFGTSDTLTMPALMEGALWGLDHLRRVFLAFTCVIWTVGGCACLSHFRESGTSAQFAVFWLLCLSGNVGLLIAQDIGSFYTLFALMTLSSYGLIAHSGQPQALRAGRIYLAMALVGEMAMLSGLILAAAPGRLSLLGEIPFAVAASEYRTWIIALLFGGFGVKAGLVGLHLWMPLAYSAAPSPASAVLGGAMLNAGLFGWIVTLPLGSQAFSGWSMLLIAMGLLSAFGAALPGLCQRDPKVVLAYSSISQMGLITLMVGVALGYPESSDLTVSAIVLYAMHHGLAKAALFFGQGAAAHAGALPGWLFLLLNALPGLSLAGLLLTSGAAAKSAFKNALTQVEPGSGMGDWLAFLMSLAAVVTFLLMARFLWCLWPLRGTGAANAGLVGSWLLGLASSLLLFWCLPLPGFLLPASAAFAGGLDTGLTHPVGSLWPLFVGLALAVLAWQRQLSAPAIPPGDLLVLFEKLCHFGKEDFDTLAAMLGREQARKLRTSRHGGKALLRLLTRILKAERTLRASTELSFLVILVCFLVALLL